MALNRCPECDAVMFPRQVEVAGVRRDEYFCLRCERKKSSVPAVRPSASAEEPDPDGWALTDSAAGRIRRPATGVGLEDTMMSSPAGAPPVAARVPPRAARQPKPAPARPLAASEHERGRGGFVVTVIVALSMGIVLGAGGLYAAIRSGVLELGGPVAPSAARAPIPAPVAPAAVSESTDDDDEGEDPADARRSDERTGLSAHDYLLAGRRLMSAGNTAGAIRALSSSLKVNARLPPAHREIGLAYAKAGNREAALRHLRTYLRLRPQGHQAVDVRRRIALLEKAR